MTPLDRSAGPTDEQRRAHDRHVHWVPLVVVLAIAALAYLWSDWLPSAPPPGYDLLQDSELLGPGFDQDQGHMVTWVWIQNYVDTDQGFQDQRQILLLLVAIGFLLNYYLPLRYKQPPLVVLTLLGLAWVAYPSTAALLLACHLGIYLIFHPRRPGDRLTLAVLASIACCIGSTFGSLTASGLTWFALGSAAVFAVLWLAYAWVLTPLLGGPYRNAIQAWAGQATLIYLLVSVILNAKFGDYWVPDLAGVGLFLLQWERLVMYRIDLRDGKVPLQLPPIRFLATFLTPAAMANFTWLNRIPVGYAYLTNSWFARDKNRVILSGLKLIGLAALFFVSGPILIDVYENAMLAQGLVPPLRYDELVEALRLGYTPPVGLVWATLIFEFFNFYLFWSGIAHFKAGVWRLLGYDIEPYFQKPFLSTNLVELWKRYSYYYREFLVQAFYYFPVFLNVFRRRPMLRVFTATLAAAGVGNLLYHVVFAMLLFGANPDVLVSRLRPWPYYLVLGIGIAATQVWQIRRGRRRRPWTPGPRIALDVLAVIGTFAFFILIRPLHHVPRDYTLHEGLRVVAAALGIGW